MATSLKTALISMPWALFNRPSIQLGCLKSFLDTHSDFQTDTFHPYLHLAQAIGTHLYYQISINAWAGEALFAPLLHPEKTADSKRLYLSSMKGVIKSLPDYEKLLAVVEKSQLDYLQSMDVQRYTLIGFSVCFSQLTSSLFLAKKIKEVSPQTLVVFGGSSCSGELGESLLKHYPFIDFIINGEGEGPLLELCNYLDRKRPDLPVSILSSRPFPREGHPVNLQSLNNLPPPHYEQYFEEVKDVFPTQPFIPVLQVEFSRGCWWNKCTFCNLNLQWENYRLKKSERMAQEVLYLAKKYEILHFAFTDNALPPKEADQFFQNIAEQNLDFDFFAEIRSITSNDRLQLYSQGCLKTAQIGIEALSNSLLKKMAKGTSVMDNIAVMKMCCENNIQLEGNLIINFPATSEQEIAETLENLEFVLPYSPLQTASFFLGHGSPIHKSPKAHNISAIVPHNNNRSLFPKKYLNTMVLLTNSYRGDKQFQTKLWRPVTEKVKNWQKLHREKVGKKLLSYKDGNTFLIIRQEGLHAAPLLHRLRGLSRKIYLFCQGPQKVEDILSNFPTIREDSLLTFIEAMSRKKLMFKDDDVVLSLAVRERTKNQS